MMTNDDQLPWQVHFKPSLITDLSQGQMMPKSMAFSRNRPVHCKIRLQRSHMFSAWNVWSLVLWEYLCGDDIMEQTLQRLRCIYGPSQRVIPVTTETAGAKNQ